MHRISESLKRAGGFFSTGEDEQDMSAVKLFASISFCAKVFEIVCFDWNSSVSTPAEEFYLCSALVDAVNLDRIEFFEHFSPLLFLRAESTAGALLALSTFFA